MNVTFTMSTKAEITNGEKVKLSKVITYGKGNHVEIPINHDGSIKWFDDSKLIRKMETA